MSILSTSAQAAGLTALVTLGFIAFCFAFLTDTEPSEKLYRMSNAGKDTSTARSLTPVHVIPTAREPTFLPPALSDEDGATFQRNATSGANPTSVLTSRNDRSFNVEARKKPTWSRDLGLISNDTQFGQVASSEAIRVGEDGSASPMPVNGNVSPAAPVATERPRPGTVGELTHALSKMGHKVHATRSGDGLSATLSVSGATLTRDVAVRWLGSAGARRELRGAGVRVVVFMSGTQSWTFML